MKKYAVKAETCSTCPFWVSPYARHFSEQLENHEHGVCCIDPPSEVPPSARLTRPGHFCAMHPDLEKRLATTTATPAKSSNGFLLFSVILNLLVLVGVALCGLLFLLHTSGCALDSGDDVPDDPVGSCYALVQTMCTDLRTCRADPDYDIYHCILEMADAYDCLSVIDVSESYADCEAWLTPPPCELLLDGQTTEECQHGAPFVY